MNQETEYYLIYTCKGFNVLTGTELIQVDNYDVAMACIATYHNNNPELPNRCVPIEGYRYPLKGVKVEILVRNDKLCEDCHGIGCESCNFGGYSIKKVAVLTLVEDKPEQPEVLTYEQAEHEAFIKLWGKGTVEDFRRYWADNFIITRKTK